MGLLQELCHQTIQHVKSLSLSLFIWSLTHTHSLNHYIPLCCRFIQWTLLYVVILAKHVKEILSAHKHAVNLEVSSGEKPPDMRDFPRRLLLHLMFSVSIKCQKTERKISFSTMFIGLVSQRHFNLLSEDLLNLSFLISGFALNYVSIETLSDTCWQEDEKLGS